MSSFENEVQKLQEEIEAAKAAENPGSTEQVSNVGATGNEDLDAQIAQIESLAAMDPSVLESQEYKDLKAQLSSGQATSSKKDEEENEEKEEEDEDEDDPGLDADNPFFAEKTPQKKVKEIPVNFDVPKEFVDIMKNHFGVNELPTFLNSVQTWRHQAQEATELRKMQDAIDADLKALPYEIKMQIDAWSKGEDYLKPVLEMKRLNYDEDFSKQDIESLVERYLPEQYDEFLVQLEKGDITEEEFTKQIGLLSKATRKMFDGDKQAFKQQREEYAEQIEKQQKQFEKSALLSVEAFSKTYPHFSKAELSKVRSTLVEGKLDDLFFNPDGTYKPEAAEFIAFALNGKKLLDTVKGKAKREGISEANKKIVDSSPKTLKSSKSTGEGQGRVDMDAVAHLQGAFKKDPYS